VERLQLGLTLQRLRLAAGKSQQEAAEAIGRSAPRLSQVENGKGALKADDLIRLLDFYGVTPAERDTVLALGRASRRRQLRHGYMDSLPDSYGRFMEMLSAAKQIGWYECGVIPGLVQSPDYVEGIMRAASAVEPEEIANQIKFRLNLQESVLTSGNAEHIDVIFTEESLLHVIGNESVMLQQALHLLTLQDRHPALSIRIVGLRTPNNPCLGGGLLTLQFDNSDPITYASAIYGSPAYYDQPSDTVRMQQRFRQISDLAWSQSDTRTALIDFYRST
jgi:transcriptional regulator with XRE-family HTH domain